MDSINEIFEKQKDKVEIHKSEPPVTGSIRWVRSLLHRIKQIFFPFLDMPEITDSQEVQVVGYFTVALFISDEY